MGVWVNSGLPKWMVSEFQIPAIIFFDHLYPTIGFLSNSLLSSNTLQFLIPTHLSTIPQKSSLQGTTLPQQRHCRAPLGRKGASADGCAEAAFADEVRMVVGPVGEEEEGQLPLTLGILGILGHGIQYDQPVNAMLELWGFKAAHAWAKEPLMGLACKSMRIPGWS